MINNDLKTKKVLEERIEELRKEVVAKSSYIFMKFEESEELNDNMDASRETNKLLQILYHLNKAEHITVRVNAFKEIEG